MINKKTTKKEKITAILFLAASLIIVISLTVATRFLYQAPFVNNFKVGIFNLGRILVLISFYILIAAVGFLALGIERKTAKNQSERLSENTAPKSMLCEIGFRKENFRRQIIIGLVVFAILFTVATVSSLFGLYFGDVRDYHWADLLYQFFISLLVVAVAEELYMRGYLFAKLKVIFSNIHIVILITSLIFGLWHFIINESWIQVLYTTVLGIVFGYARTIKKGSLLSAIIAHGLLNALLPILSYMVFLLK